MRRALVLSPTPAEPADQGNRTRVGQMTRLLARAGYAVDFVLYPMDSDFRETLPDRIADRGAGGRREADGLFVIVPPSRPLHTPPLREHHLVDEWWDPALDAQLAFLCRRRPYSVMWINYAFLSRGFAHAPPFCLRVLDTHDALAGRRELFERHGRLPEFFQMTAPEEAKALARADIVLAIKPSEAAHFERLGARSVITVPARALRDRRKMSQAPAARRVAPRCGLLRAGFIGADNAVNAAAITGLLRLLDPWRALLAPAISIVVAGGICRHVTAAPPHVAVLGHVVDRAAFYDAVDVIIAPIAFSTGLKIKVAEALAWGKPVVATADAFDGLPASDPFHALADIGAVCAALVELAADPDRLARLAAATRRSATRARAAVAAGETAVLRCLDRGRPRVVFVTDYPFWRRASLLDERGWQFVAYLASLMPTHVLSIGPTVDGPLPPSVTAETVDAAASLCAVLQRLATTDAIAACVTSTIGPPPSDAAAHAAGICLVRDRWPATASQPGHAPPWFREIVLPDGRRFAATPLRHIPGAIAWRLDAPDRERTLIVIAESGSDEPLLASLRAACPIRLVVVRTAAIATDTKLIRRLSALPVPIAFATIGAGPLGRELIAALGSWCGAACFHLSGETYPIHLHGRIVSNALQHVEQVARWLANPNDATGSERSPDAGWSILWAFLSDAGNHAAERARAPPTRAKPAQHARDAA